MPKTYIFTSESVTEGHPDKVCDHISDAILDEFLRQDPDSRVAVETLVTTDFVTVAGEVTSKGKFDIEKVVRDTIAEIGYDNPALKFDAKTCKVIVKIDPQSPNISQGVTASEQKEQGAGDQGLMFGYATNETDELMPLPILLAHKLTKKLADVRKSKELTWVRPDGKSQVSVVYVDDKPQSVETVVISTQHDPEISKEEIKKQIIDKVINLFVENGGMMKLKFMSIQPENLKLEDLTVMQGLPVEKLLLIPMVEWEDMVAVHFLERTRQKLIDQLATCADMLQKILWQLDLQIDVRYRLHMLLEFVNHYH